MIIYDIPVRTGRKIATALLARLAHEVDNIVGVKDAAGNPAETARLIAAAPAGYEVYSGDDALTLPLLAVGAVGLIGVATHWVRPRRRRAVRPLGRRRHRRRPGRQRPPARELGVRDRRRGARTRARPRRCCATSASRPGAAARRWAPTRRGSPTRAAEVLRQPDRRPWLSRVRLVFLGGLGEIGRNCMAVEQGVGDDRRILLIDCGLMFPGPDMHGIDLVLPDFTYLRENADRIDGLVATHGHEDHVGGIQFLLREVSFPIYGSALTLGLARNRIEEAGLLGRTSCNAGRRRRAACGSAPFDVEFIPVTHSVPHAHAIAVHTPQGVILHSGDFKLDLTPVDDRRTDLARIGQLAKTEGIRVLLCDSTNAEEAGYAPSERSVGRRAAVAVRRAPRPADHHGQLRQPPPPHPADRRRRRSPAGRKVATLGLSMRKNVQLGLRPRRRCTSRPARSSTSRTSTATRRARSA